MSWRAFTNVFDGPSVSIALGCDLGDVPRQFVDLVTEPYRRAHENPGSYFETLAKRSEIAGLCSFYRAVATAGGGALEVHTSEPVSGRSQTDVLFRVPTRRLDLGFRLPRAGSFLVRHPSLRELYASIDGTVEDQIWESGGIVPSARPWEYVGDRDLKDAARFVGPDSVIDTFYRTNFGDFLFAFADKAVWFRHEDSSFVEAGQLLTVINRYFTCLLDGSDWLQDPYSQ